MRSYKQQQKFKQRPKILKKLAISAIIVAVGTLIALRFWQNPEKKEQAKVHKSLDQRLALSQQLSHLFWQNDLPPQYTFSWNGKVQDYQLEYTIIPELQKEAESLLENYKPDYGAIFLMDATSGAVLSMASYQRDQVETLNLNLRASFPAASIFKVVTATAAVDRAGLSPYHKIYYNGGAYTLYRKNVLTDRVSRWTNVITLKDAFARSINTAFGRLSLEKLAPQDLNDYATRFMFNQIIPTDFPVEMGVAYIPPEKGFELAEAASGYNNTNKMSPVQGAMIASAVVNDGEMTVPYIIRSIRDVKQQAVYASETLPSGTIMTKESAEKIRILMGQTVAAGTSRRTFRNILREKAYGEVEMGGKTGHLTGDNPKGRTDWFVGYAHSGDHKLAIAAITVNKKYWTVKSSYLAQSMFRKFFNPKTKSIREIASAHKANSITTGQ
ncbi:MAG: penicillin-binding transpeptidase domain-containing protein [Pseudobdellovibrionaceae bacterium]